MKPHLFRRDRCYWCGCETFPSAKVGKSHPQCATIDHIRSKPECISGREYRHRDNKVNACLKCNQRRGAMWCRKLARGLAVATDWSLREAAKNRRRKEGRHHQPCRMVEVSVPKELDLAWPIQS